MEPTGIIKGGSQVAEDSEFMTADEVAVFLRIPLSTVYKLTQDQKLPAFRVGKHWRYKKSSIREWIDHNEQKVAAKDLTS
jgi:excisionase family DNA binding protein